MDIRYATTTVDVAGPRERKDIVIEERCAYGSKRRTRRRRHHDSHARLKARAARQAADVVSGDVVEQKSAVGAATREARDAPSAAAMMMQARAEKADFGFAQ